MPPSSLRVSFGYAEAFCISATLVTPGVTPLKLAVSTCRATESGMSGMGFSGSAAGAVPCAERSAGTAAGAAETVAADESGCAAGPEVMVTTELALPPELGKAAAAVLLLSWAGGLPLGRSPAGQSPPGLNRQSPSVGPWPESQRPRAKH